MSMNNRKTAVVLGGTVPHCELIRQLKRRGFYTLLIDYRENPPAKADADEHIQISTLDYEAVLEEVKIRNAKIVISVCVDQANVIACKISEELKLPHPYSSKTAALIADKSTMKRGLTANKIPTAPYFEVSSLEDAIRHDFAYPVVVKPTDSNSSNKVKCVRDQDELAIAVGEALLYSRNKKAIVEEYMEGKEISAYLYIFDSDVEVVGISEKKSVESWGNKTQKNHTAFMSANISEKAKEEIIKIGKKISRSFGLNNVPLLLQAMVKNDEVRVIEFAPRLGGGACFETLYYKTGVNVIEMALNSWLGGAERIKLHDNNCIVTVCHVYGTDGVFDHITGIEKICQMQEVVAIHYDRSKGEKVDATRAGTSRICYFIIKTGNIADTISTIDRIYELIDIIDPLGRSILDNETRIQREQIEEKG